MSKGYLYVKHTVITPYDKSILPVSFDEVNDYSGGLYDGKIIPDDYNPLIDPPIPDTFDERQIKSNIRIARDMFERFSSIPIVAQIEQQSALICQSGVEMPLLQTYIKSINEVSIKTEDIDENTGENIWYIVPKKDYDFFIDSDRDLFSHKLKIIPSPEHPMLYTDGYENIRIVFQRGISLDVENIPEAIKRGLIMHTLGLMRGDLYEGTTTCEIKELYKTYLGLDINFI